MIAHPPAVRPAPAAQAALQVALLGRPVVTWQGQPLTLLRRQARALLYRVAAAAQPVPREQLCYLFWPDHADVVARGYLATVLNQLKHALPAPDALVIDTLGVALNPTVVGSDVASLVVAASTPHRERLQRAVALYRGPLLDGFTLPACPEFMAWRDDERHACERRYLQVLAALVEAERGAGATAAAIAAAERYLAVDPLAEPMHQQLMTLYAAGGDRAAALAQYVRCTQALERALGVAPLPATRAVYEAVRDGRRLPRAGPNSAGGAAPAAPDRPARARTSLPAPVTPLLGRDEAVRSISALLVAGSARLLTLTGPGGAGKTRLGIAVAQVVGERFADGVVWVPLAPLRDAALVADAIVHACGIAHGGQPPRQQLCEYVRDKQLLLVIDNLEHLVAAVPLLAEVVAVGPRVRVLVTSRTRLNVAGEHAVPVAPLPLPDLQALPSLEALVEQPAVALLLDRARQSAPALALNEITAADLAAICVRLDGLPLALELAAARLRVLSPRQLLERLDACLALLTGGPRDHPARQRTLRATIEWSYRLLPRTEQRLLGRLAVFAGGWTLEAANAVCGAAPDRSRVLSGLHTLLDAHVIVQQAGSADAARFGMLETIREYAAEQFAASDEVPTIGQRHAAYFLAVAEAAAPALRGADQASVLDRLERDQDNLRTALRWAVDHDAGELALRLGTALWRYWEVRGGMREGRQWLNAALVAGAAAPAALHASVLDGAGWLAFHQSDFPQALALHEQSLRLRRALDDHNGIADSLRAVGAAAGRLGDWARFRRATEESLALYRELDDRWGMATALNNLATDVCDHANDYPRASTLYAECVALFRALGDRWLTGLSLRNWANLGYRQGDYVRAQQLADESLVVFDELGDPVQVARSRYVLAMLVHTQGDLTRAGHMYADCLTCARQQQDAFNMADALRTLAYLAIEQGDVAQAQRLVQERCALVPAAGDADDNADTMRLLGMLAHAQGHGDTAQARYRESLVRYSAAGNKFMSACIIIDVASVRTTRSDALSAARLLGAAARVLDTLGTALGIEQARYDRICAAVRMQLDDAGWARAWAAGQALTVEQALTYALEPDPVPSTPTSRRAIAADADLAATMNAARDAGRAHLTRREREVLRLVAAGHSNRAIAQALAIDVGTVKRHLHSLLGKLEAHSRTEAVARARALGLL